MSAMRGPLRFLNGHLGASVSALVDGQLDEEVLGHGAQSSR